MIDHAATETALRDSGVEYTSLRNGFYATTAAMQMTGAPKTGELAVPEDGPVDWTTHADLAEAAAVTLIDEGLTGTILNLTGSEAVNMSGIAEIASELTGRQVRRVVVPDDEYRSALIAQGLPEHAADLLLGIFIASRQRRFTLVDPTLARLIGRSPTPLRDVLKKAIPAAS